MGFKVKSKQGFWGKLERPIFTLAPMADVTDAAFRLLIARRGKPHFFTTEFVSVDGLCSSGRENLLRDLKYHEIERPIVAQLFGDKPDNYWKAAALMNELGFDGIDINMGCPMKVITKTGSGAALINTPDLAREIVQATIDGAGDLPVSVKTRIGYSTATIEEWTSQLIEANPVAITLHLRTRKEMSKVPAHWDEMPKAVEVARGSGVLILGNGDVRSIEHAQELVEQTGVDGVMLGRAIYGNPWLFDRKRRRDEISLDEVFDTMLEHAHLFEEVFGDQKKFVIMRKHLMAYCSGFRGAKDFRRALENINCAADVETAIVGFRRITHDQREESTPSKGQPAA